jgi:hypothetical protein
MLNLKPGLKRNVSRVLLLKSAFHLKVAALIYKKT